MKCELLDQCIPKSLKFDLCGEGGENREDNCVLVGEKIYKLEHELIQAVHDTQILAIIDETGSGKITQVTMYLAEARYTTQLEASPIAHNHE